MTLVSFVLMVATFRVNVLFALVFLGLVFLFAFVAAGMSLHRLYLVRAYLF